MKLLLVQADSYLTNETKEKIKKDVTNAFRQGFLVYDKGLHVQVVELDDNATTEPLFVMIKSLQLYIFLMRAFNHEESFKTLQRTRMS